MYQLFETETPIKLQCLYAAVCHDGALVKSLINSWHSWRCAPVGWKVAFLLTDGVAIYGVSTFGRPVARMEDQISTLEHTRMALGPNAPRNSASYFMAKCRHWIRENMPDVGRLISYVPTREYTGVTYRADNWTIVYEDRPANGRTWTNRSWRHDVGNKHATKYVRKP